MLLIIISTLLLVIGLKVNITSDELHPPSSLYEKYYKTATTFILHQSKHHHQQITS